jgi:hypothetical protein
MTLFLSPVPQREWREPSQRRCGNWEEENRTWFRLQARTSDGALFWRGWFDDRDDADRFLWGLATGSLRYDPALCRLPMRSNNGAVGWYNNFKQPLHAGEWFREWADLPLFYEFASVSFFTTSAGSNQTWTSPSDWNNANNQIEAIGGGASGGGTNAQPNHCTGGGGGAYSSIDNFVVATPGTTTATLQVGAGGAQVGAANGNPGGTTWFNSASDPGTGTDNTRLAADGGSGGIKATGSQNGGPGGVGTNGWGQVRTSGGRGGNLTGASGTGSSGGGGGAGPNGVGGNGGDNSSTSTVATAGGTGDNGAGGAGTPGTTGSTSTAAGVAGTEWDSTHGSGGGSGGCARVAGSATSGAGGRYGGGSGGATGAAGGTATAGSVGIVVITYTTAVIGEGWGVNRIYRMHSPQWR